MEANRNRVSLRASGRMHYLVASVLGVFYSACGAAGDVTELEMTELAVDESASPDEATEGTLAQNSAEPSVELLVNTEDAVAGELRRGDQRIAFEIERTQGSYRTTIRGRDDSLLVRATIANDVETLELGNGLMLSGPSGSLYTGAEQDFERVQISGDPNTMLDFATDPDLELARELTSVLGARGDVEARLLDLSSNTAAGATGTDTAKVELFGVIVNCGWWLNGFCGALAILPDIFPCGGLASFDNASYQFCMRAHLPSVCWGCSFTHF